MRPLGGVQALVFSRERMLNSIVKKVVGTKNERELRRIRPVVARVNEPATGLMAGMSGSLLSPPGSER